MAVAAIIVHGGSFARNADSDIYREVTKNAASKGYAVLKNRGTVVEAVEKAVRVFEEHGHFNAGRGSCLNESDEVECDAMIMDGHNLKTGAVITARCFLYPVSIARKIMDESGHCALSGEGALEFARSLENFEGICDPADLKGDYPFQKIHVTTPDFDKFKKYVFENEPVNEKDGDQQQRNDVDADAIEMADENEHQQALNSDSVGAVAIDNNGYLACAISTGGIAGKRKGRVSDASLGGCGGYANEFGGAAMTGPGEAIMKMALGKEVVTNMERGQNAQEAAENALRKMKNRINAVGGVIAIDQQGNFGTAFNTKRAVWAKLKNDMLEIGIRTEH